MSGLIALAFIGAGILLAWFFTLLFPKKLRVFVWLVMLSCATAYPFVHKFYPSYRQFQTLCASPDRFVVHEVVPVRNAYLDSVPFFALRFGQKHGFTSVDIKQGTLGYFRVTTNDRWNTPECRSACSSPSIFTWEKSCLPSCITMTPIALPEFETKHGFSSRDLIKDTLTELRSEVTSPNGSLLVSSKAYVYYPYGRSWEIALGAAGKSECRHDARLSELPYLRMKGAE